MIVEIGNDIIAALPHLARCFGKSRLVAIDQRQAPRARDVKKQAAEKREERNCGLQVAKRDSKIPLRERQTGNSVVTKKAWVGAILFLLLGAIALICAFHFDFQVQSWIAHHQNRSAKIFMRNVSRWGDWPEHAVLGGVLVLIAYWRGNKNGRAFLRRCSSHARSREHPRASSRSQLAVRGHRSEPNRFGTVRASARNIMRFHPDTPQRRPHFSEPYFLSASALVSRFCLSRC